MRFEFILIGAIGILVIACNATENQNLTIEQIYDMAQNIVNATDQWQDDLKNNSVGTRRSKFLPFAGGLLPLHALCKYKKLIF